MIHNGTYVSLLSDFLLLKQKYRKKEGFEEQIMEKEAVQFVIDGKDGCQKAAVKY